MVKVSAIIPVYNVEEYLPKCLDSLINQTLKDIEIIVVNDGSPDNSEKIIKEYSKKDKRIIYIKKENGGQGSARNLGLKKARGEYISFIDSDDWIDADMFESMYNKAKENDFDIVTCGYKNVSNESVEEIPIKDIILSKLKSDPISKFFTTVMVWDKIYKKDFLINSEIEFIENKVWYEDLCYSVNLISLTDKIDFVNKPFYNYLIREQSTMRNTKILKNLDLITIFEDISDFYRKNNIYDKYYEELEFIAIDHFSSGMIRVIKTNGNRKDKKTVLKEYDKYLRKHFYNLKNNKYLNSFSKNRRLIYNLLIKRKYRLVSLIFKVRGNK